MSIRSQSSSRRRSHAINSFSRLIVFAAIFLLIVIVFFAGTFVGFNTCVKHIESCEEVSCHDLGVTANVTKCEICGGAGIRLKQNG